ncbi:MAG: metal-dependent hydrolase [Clostridia bacterium]
MDTATHVVMGFGLAGLAHLDPAVAAVPGLAEAVMLGTVIGSQAPDLDGFTRFLGSAAYIRNHRGKSHSIPAIFIWTLLIFASVQWLAPEALWLHVLGWTFLAVFLHVFVDLFNSYGTQGLYPFSKRWVALDTIFIFDSVIFAAHLLGLGLWLAGADPGRIFLYLYLGIACYYVWRYRVHKRVKQTAEQALQMKGSYWLIPTHSWNQWTLIVKTATHWHVGEMNGNEPIIFDTFVIKPESELVRIAKTDKKVQSLLHFTSFAIPLVKEHDFGYEVKWIDLRYRSRFGGKSHYMFVAVVYLDKQLAIRDSFVGWIHRGEYQLTKKLDPEKGTQLQ